MQSQTSLYDLISRVEVVSRPIALGQNITSQLRNTSVCRARKPQVTKHVVETHSELLQMIESPQLFNLLESWAAVITILNFSNSFSSTTHVFVTILNYPLTAANVDTYAYEFWDRIHRDRFVSTFPSHNSSLLGAFPFTYTIMRVNSLICSSKLAVYKMKIDSEWP